MNAMPEEWIVRVQGKEYGPVETEELREWKAEGRLIPENEVRQVGEEEWRRAETIPEIFRSMPPPLPARADVSAARSWPEIISETFRIYRAGLGRFFVFGLLSALPLFALQMALPRMEMPDLSKGDTSAISWPVLSPVAVLLILLFIALWPISTAGFQFVADDILQGRPRTLGSQFRAALARWVQVLTAGLMVYGSYLFWFFVPFTVLLSLVAGGQISVFGLFLFLLVAAFMIYMNARLFINFLFWQQTAVLRPTGALSALQESKELARSVPAEPIMNRPLYRGAIAASIWLVVVLILTVGIQIPFMMARLVGAANPEEAMALARAVAEAKTPDTIAVIADVASAALNLLLQPLLAVVFVVLFHDARARSGKSQSDELS